MKTSEVLLRIATVFAVVAVVFFALAACSGVIALFFGG